MHRTELPPVDAESRAAMRALDSLERQENRLDSYGRESDGADCWNRRSRLTLWVPDGELDRATSFVLLKAWAKDVDQTGLTFVSREEIHAERLIVCAVLPRLGVALLKADIVGSQRVSDGYWAYELTFQGRVSTGDLPRLWRRKLTDRNGFSVH